MSTRTGQSTRERIVLAATRMMQQRGFEGAGVKQIATEAGATLGSVYHFFPGGKEELAIAAIDQGDREFAGILADSLARADDPAQAVEACARSLAEHLEASGWTDGCPISATALETTGRVPAIEAAVARVFRNWQELAADRLRAAGFSEGDARELACTVINTLEGAELSAQVFRTQEPLLVAGRHLALLIDASRR
ncbi:TetR/AcrR family transcriptional regulator [Microbacterium bovistercoris]|uniref:TetR/AcrR family transcriptional regulator n=1 Tax=Microbacterium bovistercoris TaxID=2293570 RepID=A0A371NPH0_9MICO|nr:TetR/AcrR family transcriptional regulator [Microbacterium bovistercoris]REJ04073.1 TetR/AcrR family transcriptional regulator [Microbacterium bovistercoris]